MSYASLSLDFKHLKVLVVGDVMLDQYWTGPTSRISPEAPVPVVHVKHHDYRPGGAANVAMNLVALGCQCQLMGLVGKDEAATQLTKILTETGIQSKLHAISDYPTIQKIRVLSRNQQLIRLDSEKKFHRAVCDVNPLLSEFEQAIPHVDIVVLSDYAKGSVHKARTFIDLARAHNKPIIVDPKSIDFNDYFGATLIKPNRMEFEAIVGECHSEEEINQRGKALLESSGIEALVITRGSEGLTLIQKNAEPKHLLAQSNEVYDVTGAGDTVSALLAAGLGSKHSLVEAANMAIVAAGIVVAKVGTSTVKVEEITAKLSQKLDVPTGVLPEAQLATVIQQCQVRGEKVVFANGCYDILHHGHVHFLERAKAFGDRLVVGVNGDDSIRRLKGPDRPINTIEQRMQVLAGLKAVDWVVPFNEDRPGRLIEALNPDVLIKVNERFKTVDDIPEGEGVSHVVSRGGQVQMLSPTPDCSSSQIIEAVKEG